MIRDLVTELQRYFLSTEIYLNLISYIIRAKAHANGVTLSPSFPIGTPSEKAGLKKYKKENGFSPVNWLR
jgi:hypothetical protein